MFMPGMFGSCLFCVGCAGFRVTGRVRRVGLFAGCAALFFAGFGFGLLMPGMRLMSCPSCWARASCPVTPPLKMTQTATAISV
jgi:hypothetical protein